MEERGPEALDVYVPVQQRFGLNGAQYQIIEIIDKTVGDIDDPFRIFRSVSIPVVAEGMELSASRVYHIIDELVDKGVLKKIKGDGYTKLRPSDEWYRAVKPYRVKYEKK